MKKGLPTSKEDPSATLPECPMPEDENEGPDPIAYPKPGATCVKRDDSLIQTARSKNEVANEPPFILDTMSIEHCPDFDERMTLKDGRTLAVAYP